MADAPTAFPLAWPVGWPRTAARQSGPYRTELSTALNNLRSQLRLLCGETAARTLVLSSNYTLGSDNPADPGVVAYFTWEREAMAIPCDRWQKIAHNCQAIALTIEAMRAMERHGAKHMIKAMFRGFAALPAPNRVDWRGTLGFAPDQQPSLDQIQYRRRTLAAQHHPDLGGNDAVMAEINAAADAAMAEIANG